MATNRVSYLNKTFSDFKTNLINYAKTYFPSTYNNFSDANPGALFIDMASYVGDVSSFYLDTQIQETFLLYAKEKENLFALSYVLGYTPKISYASNVVVDVFQQIPAKDDPNNPGNLIIDKDYYIIVPENTLLTSNSTGAKFITTEVLDFRDTKNTEVTLLTNGFFLLKKSVKAISAEIKTAVLNFNGPAEKFAIKTITDTSILQILDVTDAEGNKWYEVPYLAQSTILDKISNPNYNTDNVPYLTNYKKVSRRFVSRFLSDNSLQLEFGSGIGYSSDTSILPNPDNISLGLIPGVDNSYINNYNKASSFFTQEYGLAPSSNLTVRYLVGGGIQSNVPANDLTTIDKTAIRFGGNISNATATYVINNVASTNPSPATGGRNGDQIEEIRNNALYAYQSQLRAVTREDYMVRALSLPTNYGSIAKVYVTQDMASTSLPTPTVATVEERNPLSLDMYILAYTSDKKLITAANTLKQNLATYINQYRMVTDAINIKDAFYINIGINFDIVIQSGYNNNDVVTNCITRLKDFFNINNWNINQPIILSDAINVLLQTTGVQSVPKFEVINKQDSTGTTYSQYAYDIPGATRQGNIYPSIDPMIFEVRYPDTDIQGRVVPFVI
jgi:hypothetical protein